ncbi:MAG: thioesterase [Proteobacteria bacterium]|jgi:medium-chain acyl-[acyl-carrier-protein] hydrolase|nr:thioesterase [Pseudomonadota bacterium]MDB4826015.1 alpha/beta fold hydrolase [Gammaproteobacteria bacterium]MBT4107430.1 thioesterase [Pseudomonadota bacterium]MBT4987541.1 thioesterase [Pseudomonadota bacterium]MBT5189569.1 thioesterase [Pseudomonadota bacterium]
MKFNQWITCPEPKPEADLRLFCLPFAGGGASIYRAWSHGLGPKYEVCPIQLPGRENRAGTSAVSDSKHLAEMIASQMSLYLDKPYLVYGHSMGGLLAYEALKQLENAGHALPKTAFIGAHRAPHLPPRRSSMIGLSDHDFIQKISSFGGFEKEVLDSQELIQFILPTLRADFSVCDGYQYHPYQPLDCPLVVFSGTDDPEVPPSDMDEWGQHSIYPLQHISLPAGHFFLKTHATMLQTHIRQFSQR